MRTSVIVLAGLCVAGIASVASAQVGQPLGGRLTISINGAAQPGSQDITRATAFILYDEPADVVAAQKIEGGSVFDIGAAYRVQRNLGVGLTYTHLSNPGGGTMSGGLPHPIFTDSLRPFNVGLDGLAHRERGIHLQAVYYMPFVENIDFTFSAGPSFFTVTQGFPSGISFDEVPPFDTVIVGGVGTETRRRSAVGFNIGADGTYSFTENIGAGVLLRYTRARANFDIEDSPRVGITAGGFQIGAGLRLRF